MRIRSKDGNHFGDITPLPGCNQVAVSHGVFTVPHMRGVGRGYGYMGERLDRMTELGYDYVLATVIRDNEPQIRLMRRHALQELSSFMSSYSGKEIVLFGRGLYLPPPPMTISTSYAEYGP